MKKALLVILIMLSATYLTLYVMTNLVHVNAQNLHSHSFHGVKILSPSRGEEVPVNIQNFVVRGVSTDNSTNSCELSLLPNGITPYLGVNAKGQGGSGDFSVWDRQFGSDFPMNVGENKITARLMCMNDDGNNKTSKYQTINFTGVSDNSSGLTPATTTTDTATTDTATTDTATTDTATTDTNTRFNSSEPSSSPTEENPSMENRSALLETENNLEDGSYKNLEKRITFGPIIIPPQQEAAIKKHGQKSPDAVIIPAQDKGEDGVDKRPTDFNTTTISSDIHETSSIDSLNRSFTDSIAPTEVIIPTTNVTTITVPFCLSSTVNDQSRALPIKEAQPEGSQSSLPSSDMPFVLLTPSPNLRQGEQPLQERTEQVVSKQIPSSPDTIVENNESKVKEGSIVSLNASDSCFRDGTTVSFIWKQPTNHSVEILGDFDSSILTFRAPNVYHDTALQFELITSDSEGNSESTNVQVLVEDATDAPINIKNQSNVRVPLGPGSETVESTFSNVLIPDQSDQRSSNLLNKSIEDPKPLENISSERSPMDVPWEKTQSFRASAGIDQVVNEGMGVTLQGDITSSIGNEGITYKWSQIDEEPRVSLEELGGTMRTSFTAPEVSGDTLLTFRFDASTVDGDLVSSDVVSVTIKDLAEPVNGDNGPDRLDDIDDNSDDDNEEEDEDDDEEEDDN
jgi:hypothetical protein